MIKILLIRASAVLFIALGVAVIFWPRWTESLYPLSLNADMAVSAIRAIFGGMMLGVGFAALWLDFVRRQLGSAADLIALVTLGLLIARAVGIYYDGVPFGPVRNEAIFELILFIALIASGALRKL